MSKKTISPLRALIGELMSRSALGAALGMQFGGARDLYKVFGYTKQIGFKDYYGKFRRQDIAKRIVNAPASATWRNPPILKTSASYKKEWDALVQEHKIWGEIERVDRLAGLGQYAVLLLGIGDGRKMNQMVSGAAGTKLLYLQPYAQPNAKIKTLNSDPTSERFGLPEMYTICTMKVEDIIDASSTSTAVKTQEMEVHWSRVVHIAEDCLESNYLGTPRLESVYNLLDDLLKVAGGTAETYWLIGNRGMQLDVDPDMQLTEADAEALSDEADEYQHGLRRIMRTRGVKVNALGSDSPDPKNTFDMIISLISGATGIPKRVLTGSEAGQLASDQDRANWADRIKERRTTFAEPNVLLPLLLHLMKAGVLPSTKLTKLDYEWPPNFQLTPLEEAQSMAQKARAAINLSKQYNKGNQPLMSLEECRLAIGLPEKCEVGTIPAMVEDIPPTPAVPTDPNATDTTKPAVTDIPAT